MYTDTVADMLTRIRNASARKHPKVEIPHSRVKEGIANVLKEEGYIVDFKVIQDEAKSFRRHLFVFLKYTEEKEPVIHSIQRVSKPGKRVFRGVKTIGKVLDGLGTTVLSTSKGIVSQRAAQKMKMGGEIICRIW